jgi:hypothetical protein
MQNIIDMRLHMILCSPSYEKLCLVHLLLCSFHFIYFWYLIQVRNQSELCDERINVKTLKKYN